MDEVIFDNYADNPMQMLLFNNNFIDDIGIV